MFSVLFVFENIKGIYQVSKMYATHINICYLIIPSPTHFMHPRMRIWFMTLLTVTILEISHSEVEKKGVHHWIMYASVHYAPKVIIIIGLEPNSVTRRWERRRHFSDKTIPSTMFVFVYVSCVVNENANQIKWGKDGELIGPNTAGKKLNGARCWSIYAPILFHIRLIKYTNARPYIGSFRRDIR